MGVKVRRERSVPVVICFTHEFHMIEGQRTKRDHGDKKSTLGVSKLYACLIFVFYLLFCWGWEGFWYIAPRTFLVLNRTIEWTTSPWRRWQLAA